MSSGKALLIILDGWGLGQINESDAIAQANTPFVDNLMEKYPNSTLVTYGTEVGLPNGQMGNSEVGHLNIGAGRIVYQELARIKKSIEDKSLHENKHLIAALKNCKNQNKAFHLIGLCSDGGVHSHVNHLKALIEIAEHHGPDQIYIHAFTDGRDVDPKSGKGFLEDLLIFLKGKRTLLATVIGRYYAMDRDQRWDRIKKAYDLLVHSRGTITTDIINTIQEQYDQNITDEFLPPLICSSNGTDPICSIKEQDTVMCYNFRTDRPRQITRALTQEDFPEQQMSKLDIHYITMTRYDAKYNNITVLFDKEDIRQTLGEVLSSNNRTQTRIAETEKYPHVTFFFNGGREQAFENEHRIHDSFSKSSNLRSTARNECFRCERRHT